MTKTIATIALAAALALTGCSTTNETVAPTAERTSVTTTPATTPTTASTTVVPTTAVPETTAPDTAPARPDEAFAVRAISVVDTLVVTSEPGGGDVVAELDDRTDFGSARVLLATAQVDGHVQVLLPVRPNGASGWVSTDDVALEVIEAMVTVDLEARTATTWLGGEIVRTADVAVGSAENPTPTGTFYITDKIETADPDSAYGPFALGLSAHSDTLTEFAGGDGQIGLHGTNDPASIGLAVSHGCVRFPNELISALAAELPLGTPVVIF